MFLFPNFPDHNYSVSTRYNAFPNPLKYRVGLSVRSMTEPTNNSEESKLLTIEAEYTLPTSDQQTKNLWTFEEHSPRQAKDLVLRNYIPLDATVQRVGAWFGTPADRPDGGHEAGIFEQENNDR